jgi:hypothetical protein
MKNGFDLTNALYPEEKIAVGIASRDGVPPIDKPKLVEARHANLLNDEDIILGVEYNGVARAYPRKIMNWHQVVNDDFNGTPMVITFCPLCGSGMAFRREIAGQTRTFGVSGLVYNNNVLVFDRESESLWCQIESRAIAGPMKEQPMEYIMTHQTRWGTWRKKHPQTMALTIATGSLRYYDREPFTGYEKRGQIFFPLEHEDNRYHPKERVVGIEVHGHHKVYPYKELMKVEGGMEDKVGEQPLWIHYSPHKDFVAVQTPEGKTWPHITLFWFAWLAFHPQSEVFMA